MKMGSTNPFKDQSFSFPKKLFPFALYALLAIALLRLYFYPLRLPPSPDSSHLPQSTVPISSHSSFSPPAASSSVSSSAEEARPNETPCDYFNGKWVRDNRGPLYNGTTCGTIKEGQNCISHGRPDTGYLYWRWKPTHCDLARFEPQSFLQLVRHKHLAFVGDSMARNQLESLLCMLATVSTPNLVYRNGEDNKFRRWRFASHNVTISVYWSPFLVKGVEKSSTGPNHNELYLDLVDERWAKDLNQIDLIVLSIGHWFLHPAVYYEGDSVLGCHYCPGLNHTEIGFYDVLRKALRTTLKSIIERTSVYNNRDGIKVTVTTFSPAHFEGEWDKAGACPKTEPFREEEKELEGMDSDMRKIEVEEVEGAKANYNEKFGRGLRLEAMDVTKLALMRPDGHPGPYMYPFPFADGAKERVQNDCVHWCLPGPIDTWNEIFLQMINKWNNNDQPTSSWVN
ncbi:protein ALTERED XYLOGLUCAN 4-like [Neltuma alba]|uniref:protein ALTERED XYLOGLUCAN 4-like n=1 Tax=Neltuma alba TaxID=207710 RepID=UPI0010A4EEDD|nr:protein ALTERED XYLOGLUCAN 4-like [Prosopis alba]